jgi:hypothetical protein
MPAGSVVEIVCWHNDLDEVLSIEWPAEPVGKRQGADFGSNIETGTELGSDRHLTESWCGDCLLRPTEARESIMDESLRPNY